MIAYLSARGLEPAVAFAITERVRKGRRLRPEDMEGMRRAGVPEWYIGACEKITYLFPKAHAVAYVTMALRIAYFKVHRPEAHYAALFTVRGEDVDGDLLRRGPEAVAKRLRDIDAKGNEATPKERSEQALLEIAREMFARGVRVRPVDLYGSHAERFSLTPDGLLPPFLALPGLGRTAATAIVQARAEGPFTSVENLRVRARLQRPILELLGEQGCLRGLPQTSQLTLF
jgi:DNA polymerase III subunit alpha, Gram-positive type